MEISRVVRLGHKAEWWFPSAEKERMGSYLMGIEFPFARSKHLETTQQCEHV